MTKLTYDEYQAGAGTTYATVFMQYETSGRVYGGVFGKSYLTDCMLEVWCKDKSAVVTALKQFCADRGLTTVDMEYRITTL